MCSDCRLELADMEMMGEALLLPRAKPGPLELHDFPVPPKPIRSIAPKVQKTLAAAPEADELLPLPIVRKYGLTFATVPWRRLGPGVWHARLPLSPSAQGDLRLLRIAPGRAMPVHGHGGTELTLVLTGAYGDETGRYCRGDIQDLDEDDEHKPIADPGEGCVCLIASERPARFKGLVGRFINPLTGM
jgi:putative transcriptional regulator